MKDSIQHPIVFFLLCIYVSIVASNQYRNFVLGGLFSVHEKGEGSNPCGAIMKETGIQRMEAMFYAVKKINEDSTFWNFTLEAKMLDTCSSSSHTVQGSLNFLKDTCNTNDTQRVTGVIGPTNSPVSEPVATILHFFQIPQISYESTSRKLDDMGKYPYFFRVVPSDKYQVHSIVDALRQLKWTFLSTVVSQGEYGENAFQDLQSYARSHGICIGANVTIPRNARNAQYDEAIDQLLHRTTAKAVVVFLREENLKKLLAAAKKAKVKNRRLLWFGSNTWGIKPQIVNGLEDVAEGAVTILPTRFPVPEFDEYFTSLKPKNNSRNKWFQEFWKSHFNCTFGDDGNHCTGEEDLTDSSYKQESLVPMVIDAVFVMAHALKNMCSNEPIECENWNKPPSGKKLKSYIERVCFASSRGHDLRVSFDSNRSVPANFTIYQFRKNSEGEYAYNEIGSWSTDGLKITDLPTGMAESICNSPCQPRFARIYEDENKKCCWKCRECPQHHYVPNSTSSCSPCKEGFVLNNNATGCVWMDPEYFGKDMGNHWSLIPVMFAILGIVFCILMYVIIWIYYDTPIVMASDRDLCHLIFLGVFLCYCFTFTLVVRPNLFNCGVVRVGLGLGLAICNSAIFIKTNRISRIFNLTLVGTIKPRFITLASQLVFVFFLVAIQLAFSGISLLLKHPQVRKEQPDKAKPLVETCKMGDETVCLALAFNAILIVMCTVFAYKTRKVPENFNEAKYICFAMYSTCIIWMAFVPTYFIVSSNYKVRSILLSMGVSLSGTVTLFCIFTPKLYIVIFQPHKNVRSRKASKMSNPASISASR